MTKAAETTLSGHRLPAIRIRSGNRRSIGPGRLAGIGEHHPVPSAPLRLGTPETAGTAARGAAGGGSPNRASPMGR